MAGAADAGYRLIIAFLGVTNLLLEQNTGRIEAAFGIGRRVDYRWVLLKNPRGKQGADELAGWVDRGRVVLIPVLKHSGRINAVADVVARAGCAGLPTLIVDDEADQASLNTQVNQEAQSQTYASILRLKESLTTHLYVQYTATPYAPLLLEPADALAPDFVEMLQPGPGYTGGREFFVDEADRVVRPIPTMDEQSPKGLPTLLPGSLIDALASFIAGTALLLGHDIGNAPVSMLIHSTYKNDVQERYRFLVDRRLRQWRKAAESASGGESLPAEIRAERRRLLGAGAADLIDDEFVERVHFVLREVTLWLVNSASDVRRIDWTVAPVHILIGGNKLDRGFTVEGLTVSYMNRPASPQVDTLEQRARAFGYRQDLLPYCQFFAPPRTLEGLRGIVFTEYDLRAEFEDWVESGGSVAGWAHRIGLLLPPGTKPTRDAVITAVSRFNYLGEGWHSLRRPDLEASAIDRNRQIVRELGLESAEPVDYGRVRHRTLRSLTVGDARQILDDWSLSSYSPGWRHAEIVQFLARLPDQGRVVPTLLLEQVDGRPRERRWDVELGFVNLFQGPDLAYVPGGGLYPGDRDLFDRSDPTFVELQVHRVHPRDNTHVRELFTLAINLGRNVVVRRGAE